MSDKPPRPPGELPPDVVETLDECSPELLRRVSRYAEELAEYRRRENRQASGGGEEEDQSEDGGREAPRNEDQSTDLPEDVPSKATITIKEINENRYYYWQWRDGDKVRSRYKGPVDADG